MKQIDLDPREYRADIPNKKEPILGDRWQEGVAYFIGLAISFIAIHLVLGR